MTLFFALSCITGFNKVILLITYPMFLCTWNHIVHRQVISNTLFATFDLQEIILLYFYMSVFSWNVQQWRLSDLTKTHHEIISGKTSKTTVKNVIADKTVYVTKKLQRQGVTPRLLTLSPVLGPRVLNDRCPLGNVDNPSVFCAFLWRRCWLRGFRQKGTVLCGRYKRQGLNQAWYSFVQEQEQAAAASSHSSSPLTSKMTSTGMNNMSRVRCIFHGVTAPRLPLLQL